MNLKKKINNFTLFFDLSGSIFISELRVLVISDLHIGKSHSLAKMEISYLHSILMKHFEKIKINITSL